MQRLKQFWAFTHYDSDDAKVDFIISFFAWLFVGIQKIPKIVRVRTQKTIWPMQTMLGFLNISRVAGVNFISVFGAIPWQVPWQRMTQGGSKLPLAKGHPLVRQGTCPASCVAAQESAGHPDN